MQVDNLISKAYSKSLGTSDNIFDLFNNECNSWYDSPCNSISDFKKQTTKMRGDIFESFCVLYLSRVRGFENVWLLKDVPEDILSKLSLKRRDIGIDIVAQKGDRFYAIQCKFKKIKTQKVGVPWKELSTFWSLCARTGPWEKHIVMTTASFVSHMGYKGEKDLSICLKTFQNLSREQWLLLMDDKGHTLTEEKKIVTPLSSEQVREARLKYLSKTTL